MTFNSNLPANNRLSTMTATATRLALPITLGDDFPYKEAFLEKLSFIRGNDSTWHSAFLAAWLTPEETLRKLGSVSEDFNALCDFGVFDESPETFDEASACNANDDFDATVEKYLTRKLLLTDERTIPHCFADSVLDSRPGDVTADGREVAK